MWIIYTDEEAEVEEIIFLHAVAQVQRNQAKEKKKAVNKLKKAPAPINKDTDSEESFKRLTEGYLWNYTIKLLVKFTCFVSMIKLLHCKKESKVEHL